MKLCAKWNPDEKSNKFSNQLVICPTHSESMHFRMTANGNQVSDLHIQNVFSAR